MMHMRCDFFSETLGLSTSMTVLLPQQTSTQIGMPGVVREHGTPVLYLLHGLSDDDTIWLRRTSIERYASDLGLAVVMPQVHRSFYTNSDVDPSSGLQYWDFVSRELPELVAGSFQVSTRREDTFVAGLSMGGYGSFKLALRQPERFAAAASLSGCLDIARQASQPDFDAIARPIWGERSHRLAGTEDDLLHLLDTVDPAVMPKLWTTCGTEDFLIDSQRTFVRHAADRGVDLTWDEHPGTHEWGYWDTHIQRFLRWLPLASA